MNTLKTALDGDLSNDGVMFDVIASPGKSVMVKTLSFYSTTSTRCDVEVYTKLGSHEYFEQTRNAWINVVNVKTQCMGPQFETVISEKMFKLEFLENLGIQKGERRAFYIRVDGSELIYSATLNYNQIYAEDNNMQILEGSGVNGYFLDYVTPRMWNGALKYDLISSEDDQFDECSSLLEVNVNEGGGSSNKNYGIMFNIESRSNEEIVVEGLAFYTGRNINEQFEIYTFPLGFEYGMMSTDRWQKISEGTCLGTFESVIIAGDNFKTVTIPPRATQGFYITLQSPFLLYRTTSLEVGSTYIRNDDIVVSVGIGIGEYPLTSTSAFYNSRGFYGKVLYGFKSKCSIETTVTYNFVVYYPNVWEGDDVFQEVAFIVKKNVLDMIDIDEDFKDYSKADELEFTSVLPYADTSGSSSCANMSSNKNCILIATNVTLTHDKDIDPGIITFGLLKNTEKLTEGLNGGNLDVYYAGDEPLDTKVVVTLNGVPKKRMGLAELQYFQEKTKGFLAEQVDAGTVEILGVEVERQTLDIDDVLYASESKFNQRGLQEDTASIDLETVVTGKHRPPSPGLDFNILIEDSINAEDSDFKEELMDSAVGEAGSSYFEAVDDIRALVVTASPTVAPGSDVLVYKGTISEGEEIQPNGLSIMAIIGVVIGAAILAFLVVFGAFIWYRRQKEKSQFEMESVDNEYDDDEESPLFHDIFKRKKGSKPMLKRSLSRRRSTLSTIKGSDQISDPSMHNAMHSPTLTPTTIEVSALVDDHGQEHDESDSYAGYAPMITSDSENSGNATVDIPDEISPTITHPPRTRRATMSFNPQPNPEFEDIRSNERERAASGSQLLDNDAELKPRQARARRPTMGFSSSNVPPSPGDSGEHENTSRTSKRRSSTTRLSTTDTSVHSYNTQELHSKEPKQRRRNSLTNNSNRQFENRNNHGISRRVIS